MRRKEDRVQGMGVLLKKVQRGAPMQSAQGPPDRKGPVCPQGRYVLPANTVFPIDACQRDNPLSLDIFRASSLCMTGRAAPGAVGGHDQGGETLKSGPGQGLWCAKACLASGPFCHPKFVPLLFHFFSQNSAKDSNRKQNLRLSRD